MEEGTRGGLVGAAAWLLRPALMNFLSDNLEWALGPKIDELTDEAREIIASRNLSDEFELRGTLKTASFKDLRVTEEGVEVGLILEGDAALTYMPAR